ncbi:hypothetical protein A1O1_07152 [Capronia coronata CBS 617.96]|uniref:Transcription initiation factor TFIIA large subunit n=1 Tax=Capronia coronata CBS 617.96 TaxID=1182541 RepID=W9YMN4_9EURO|nr:uncharacterized protein A1O1_07152 [Capronia coronata CBS 617.96]EXJ83529.1 hypothetical protein A1O1_07152 [Capronia coronata CBS 617.96]
MHCAAYGILLDLVSENLQWQVVGASAVSGRREEGERATVAGERGDPREWQKKLSGLKVAQLPWDPAPVPIIKDQPTVPSNAKPIPPTLPSNGNTVTSTPPPQPPIPSPAPIKTENNAPSYPPQAPPPQQYQVPSFNGEPMTARDRAAMNLHQSFGQRAGPQIAQLQSNQPRAPSQLSAPPTGPYIKQEDSASTFSAVQDHPADVKPQIPTPLQSNQTDGADDARDTWATEYARRKALAAAHGAENDRLMRAYFEARQQELEGGGLLLNLDERNIPSKSMSRKVNDLAGMGPSTTPSITRVQGDATGDDDDDIDDEDAINSDLDDPDELAANEEDGENTDQVMLCTYDKVQRVKNKWKCTLKDGIFRVDGTEYVFHKGQGEFEW